MSDKLQFDIGGELDDRSYKSSFARSVAINSQFNQSKSMDYKPLHTDVNVLENGKEIVNKSRTPQNQDAVRIAKIPRICQEDVRLFPCNINSTSRPSQCPLRVTEIPVENFINQSKIETLQWQLKEIQKSREMYRAVMKQVVTYLEKAHHSLELLGHRMNRRNSSQRPRSEHRTLLESTRCSNDTTLTLDKTLEDRSFKDFTWRPTKETDQPSSEEIPPDKLAQEAFRLFRTAQSLLNTREPDLAQSINQSDNDIEFIAQIAKEFPTPEIKTQRATSFSLSPKLILPETDLKISSVFNRKLSLQLGDARRYSKSPKNVDSARGSVAESDVEVPTDSNMFSTPKSKSEKSNSPANGSISSVEDESGFSSMNSFQDVGLPLINSTMTDGVTTKNALLRSMIQNSADNNTTTLTLCESTAVDAKISCSKTPPTKSSDLKRSVEDIKLWKKSPVLPSHHKRWFSTPVEDEETQSLKVLWV